MTPYVRNDVKPRNLLTFSKPIDVQNNAKVLELYRTVRNDGELSALLDFSRTTLNYQTSIDASVTTSSYRDFVYASGMTLNYRLSFLCLEMKVNQQSLKHARKEVKLARNQLHKAARPQSTATSRTATVLGAFRGDGLNNRARKVSMDLFHYKKRTGQSRRSSNIFRSGLPKQKPS